MPETEKAIVCSIDGVPARIGLVPADDADQVQRNLYATKQFDRVDIMPLAPIDVIQIVAFKAALEIEDDA